jgi:hypothetical protein
MKWVFETYSNVYQTAMMQDSNKKQHVAPAKASGNGKRSTVFGFLSRR